MSIVVQYKLPLKGHATGELLVHPNQSIFEIKQVAAKHIGATAPLKLFYRGKALRDNQNVADCHLAADGYYLIIMEQRSTIAPRSSGLGSTGLKGPNRRPKNPTEGGKKGSATFVGVKAILGSSKVEEKPQEGIADGTWNPEFDSTLEGPARVAFRDEATGEESGGEFSEDDDENPVVAGPVVPSSPKDVEFANLLSSKLDTLQSRQESVEGLSHWIQFHKKKSSEVVKVWVKKMQVASGMEQRQLNLLYLCNQILQTSSKKGNHYVNSFTKGLPQALQAMAGTAKNNEKLKGKVENILGLWETREVLPPIAVHKLRDLFRGKELLKGDAKEGAMLTGKEAAMALADFAAEGNPEEGKEAKVRRTKRRFELMQYVSKEIRVQEEELERCRARRLRVDDTDGTMNAMKARQTKAEADATAAAEPEKLDLAMIAEIMTQNGVPMDAAAVEEMLKDDPHALDGLDLGDLSGMGGDDAEGPLPVEGTAEGVTTIEGAGDNVVAGVKSEEENAGDGVPATEEDHDSQFANDVQSQLMALLTATPAEP